MCSPSQSPTPEAEQAQAQQTEDHLALLEKLLAVRPATPSFSQLADALGWKNKSRAERAMKELAARKLVEKSIENRWELTKKGIREGQKLMEKGTSYEVPIQPGDAVPETNISGTLI